MSDIQLRWLVTENRITAEQVKAYADKVQLPMMHAKDILRNRSEPKLQYRAVGPYEPGNWRDVETVTVYNEVNENEN